VRIRDAKQFLAAHGVPVRLVADWRNGKLA
jgi:hypothetical protein